MAVGRHFFSAPRRTPKLPSPAAGEHGRGIGGFSPEYRRGQAHRDFDQFRGADESEWLACLLGRSANPAAGYDGRTLPVTDAAGTSRLVVPTPEREARHGRPVVRPSTSEPDAIARDIRDRLAVMANDLETLRIAAGAAPARADALKRLRRQVTELNRLSEPPGAGSG